jgi:hypothetical protein
MKNMSKELTTVANQLNKLAKKIDKMAEMYAKPPKSRTPAIKKTQVAKKKAATKKKNLTPTDQVLIIMKRFRKGITVSALREKSGLTEKQISNIVHRACKKDRMKRVGRGVYSVYGL